MEYSVLELKGEKNNVRLVWKFNMKLAIFT